MDKIAYDKMTRQFLFAPLALMVSLVLGIAFYLSYTKYDNSKNSIIGLTAASNFYADMSTVDRLYAEAEGDVTRFQDESVKSEKVSAWMLKFSDDKLIVLASSKHPQTVGGALPRQICDISGKDYESLKNTGKYSKLSFGANSLIDVCDFKIVKDVVIGYDSQQFYKISGLGDPNFSRWYWANLSMGFISIAVAFSIIIFMYSVLYRKIRSSYFEVEKANIELSEQAERMRRDYYYDSLTGLPNINSLREDVESMQNVNVVVMDIDDFSKMNNYFGTRICDQVLMRIAKFNADMAEKWGMKLYRQGSDTFAFVDGENFFIDKYEEMAEELIDNLKGLVLDIDREEGDKQDPVEVHCTIGFALDQGDTLKKAMIALAYAKQTGRDYFCYLKQIDDTVAYSEQIKRSNMIRDAIVNDRIVPYYQPIFDKNKNVTKYETLIRIQDSGEIVSPGAFIGISKRIKRYVMMEKMLIEKSFKLISQKKDVIISINLSARDMSDGDVSVFVIDQINKYQIADRIIFEILEDEDMKDLERITKFIERVRRMGVRIAIDDFGSGYSNFANILKLKPDFIKIDGSIIKNIDTNIDSKHIARAIVAFCKQLDIKVVAEFVESKEVFDACTELGIDEFQGFYLGKPSQDLFRG